MKVLMYRRWNLIVLFVVLAGLLAVPAVAKDQERTFTSDPNNPMTPQDEPYRYTSVDGDFRIIWPSGCSKIKIRTPGDEGDADSPYPVIVSCDRHGEDGAGCSVMVIFNAQGEDGSPAGPDQVMVNMQNLLRDFGAEVKQQSPLHKDFGEGLIVEGLDVLAAQAGGSGQVWLRGLLVGGDIYLLSAWDLSGKVWNNPEYVNFFNSFQPGTE